MHEIAGIALLGMAAVLRRFVILIGRCNALHVVRADDASADTVAPALMPVRCSARVAPSFRLFRFGVGCTYQRGAPNTGPRVAATSALAFFAIVSPVDEAACIEPPSRSVAGRALTICNNQTLSFNIHGENKDWLPKAGLYIFTYQDTGGIWRPLYVGQTDDFSARLPSH